MQSSPTPRLVLGLVATLLAVAAFALYALQQLDGLRQLQKNTIDRARADSLDLLRIQDSLHAIGLAMADADNEDTPSNRSWHADVRRIRSEFDTALKTGNTLVQRPENTRLFCSLKGFWAAVEANASLYEAGHLKQARAEISTKLESQHQTLLAGLSRLLVENYQAERSAEREVAAIYDRVERNVYLLSVVILVGMTSAGLLMMNDLKRIFDRVAHLSEQKSTLARRLISVQEEVLRSVARELHDDFGQILTAVGAMVQSIEKRHGAHCATVKADLYEVRQVVQEALEKTRSFSQALHPTILDDYGLERAIERYLPNFEKQTGISVRLEQEGTASVPDESAIHVYRVMQEALTNVARHARASEATVRLSLESHALSLEVEDNGVGIDPAATGGLGMIAMRERAELVHGVLEVAGASRQGTVVRLRIPLDESE